MNIPYPSIIKWPANINDHIQRVLILSPDFTNKNNISVPSAYLIGNDEDGRAYDLKAVLESYISFLNELAQDDQVMKERICSARSQRPGFQRLQRFRNKTELGDLYLKRKNAWAGCQYPYPPAVRIEKAGIGASVIYAERNLCTELKEYL